MFARPVLKLPHEIFACYTGNYRVDPQVTIEFIEDHGDLVLLAPSDRGISWLADETRMRLLAESETSFYVNGPYLFLRFQKNEAGKVTGCEVEAFSGRHAIVKID